ncbi:2767_t:CDS:2 [Paraglomus occultum]|uniref:2767_t:CDS:1 n=1 Tax=Paraglomus occultum TaxID=144539 RepID=A0A9N9C5B8_9GLOM|nr:2767_t:CDS:2 [Paraglomus occultum]
MVYLFDVPAFLILFRETVECSVILAVLLSFVNKFVPEDNPQLKKKLKRQIWIGTAAGLALTLMLGAIFVAIFYTIASNLWENSEAIWEGVFSLLAAIVTLIMSFGMIRVKQWKTKWEGKLKDATERYLDRHKKGEKWALIVLPFTVVAREGLESFVFIAGIGFNNPASGLPIPVVTGILAGFAVGYFIYKGSNVMSLNIFFGVMTVFLFLISSGLFTTAVDELHEATGKSEIVLWKLECCSPETDNGWKIANALLGWRNEATLHTTLAYIAWWVVIAVGLTIVYRKGKKERIEDIVDDRENEKNVEIHDDDVV